MIVLESKESRRSFLRKFGAGLFGATAALNLGKGLKAFPAVKERCTSESSGVSAHDEVFWKFVRQQFPLTHERTYFNNGGLGPCPRVVVDTCYESALRLTTISETGYGERHQVHEKAASFLGCDVEEIAITRNTTEGMNIIARGLPLRKGDEVLMSTHEHVGGSMPFVALMKDIDIRIKLFEPGKNHAENLQIIEDNLTKRTRVLMISHIPCTTGLVFPVKEIADLCHQRDILVFYDGAHPPGQIPVDLRDIGCDFYAASGHKWLLGPLGTGLLYIRKDMFDVWKPTYVGAYSNAEYDFENLKLEYRREAEMTEYGTRNTPLVLALGAAIDFIDTIGIERIAARGAALAAHLKEGLLKIPNLEILTPLEPEYSASIVTFRSKTHSKTEIQEALSERNFRVRSIGEHKLNAIRVSSHVYTSFEEVDRLLEALMEVVGAYIKK